MSKKSGMTGWVMGGVLVAAGAGWWLQDAAHAQAPAAGEAPKAAASGEAPKAGGAAAPAPAAAASGAASAAPPTLVTVATVTRQDVPVTVAVNGVVISLTSIDVRPQVTNVIQKVHVKEGQFVKAGETLFTLDDRADRANLDRALAQQKRDEALLVDLERQLKRSQDLVAQNFIAQSAADATASQVEAQRAAVAADKAAVQSAQVALSYDAIRSPITGRIGQINLFAGSLAQPSVIMLTVTQLDPIAISFPVPEVNLQDLLAAAKTRSPVMATVAGQRAPIKGALSFVDNTVDSSVGTVKAKAVFENKSQLLWPGQYVNTSVTVRTIKDATVVPISAVITTPNGKIVYTVNKDEQAQPRRIQLDHAFGDRAVVTGLNPGERVVVEGKQNLRPGAKVRIERAGADKAAGDRPAGDKPAGDKPAADKPATDKAATDKTPAAAGQARKERS